MKAAATLRITQAFTSYNNPKGDADTERLMRTLKEELLWLREWTSPLELEQSLTAWVEWYNTRLAFGTRLSDTVSGRTTTSHQPQHSVRGRLTTGEHYTFCDQTNTILNRTLTDKAHPFNPIQEEAQCEGLIDSLSR